MLLPAELIASKRDGAELAGDEIRAFVRGVAEGSVTDAQIAAFAMAVWFQGLSVHEQGALTLAMRDSGRVLAWPGLDGPALDKHSTGGVGDFVSLIVGPLIASAGGFVPMISGRGLGHTGGTLDKMESIPDLATDIEPARFQDIVREVGVAIIGQTSDLAPADRRIYAVRDVTATVASMPLIVSSILSKKLAEGLDGLVMDIKFGSGAFMSSIDEARELGESLCRVARESGLACDALLTDMGRPIAWSAGNALEVGEAVAFLRGDRCHPAMRELVLGVAGELLQLGQLAADDQEARACLTERLDSGAAAERFAAMVRAQGGHSDFVARAGELLPRAPVVRPVTATAGGVVESMDMRELGLSVIQLGGGRRREEDRIDPSVGLAELCQPGTPVDRGQPLCFIHAADETGFERAAERVRRAVRVGSGDESVAAGPVIRERIRGERVDE